ncbi:hypothetical protein KUV50_04915 [Membranicola marinus]|uniref:DUF6794 domain-containing protein n=1 Tax=Membranihabitans marinus TaxID=1227546 RepID=A0A953HVT5_9BACT|nr:DUF6794 domain-containing protein [Membranihabitans marinus]MBY5957466.1 hypothetical protein [Membranihabitans marinus]
MKYYIITGIIVLLCPLLVAGQDSLHLNKEQSAITTFAEEYQKEYLKRIQKSHINGFYIPKDLPDALRILDEIVDDDGKRKFRSREDSVAVNKVFFSFGRWINLNWGMELGSRLTVALNKLGVSYPDDMTRMIMYAWHRHLNNEPLALESLADRVIQERIVRAEKVKNLARDKP